MPPRALPAAPPESGTLIKVYRYDVSRIAKRMPMDVIVERRVPLAVAGNGHDIERKAAGAWALSRVPGGRLRGVRALVGGGFAVMVEEPGAVAPAPRLVPPGGSKAVAGLLPWGQNK